MSVDKKVKGYLERADNIFLDTALPTKSRKKARSLIEASGRVFEINVQVIEIAKMLQIEELLDSGMLILKE